MDRYQAFLALVFLAIPVTAEATIAYSRVGGWTAYHSGEMYYYSTPEAAIDSGIANAAGHNLSGGHHPNGVHPLLRTGSATIADDCTPLYCGIGGAHGTPSGFYDMTATAPGWNVLFGVETTISAYRKIIPEGTPQIGPIPEDDREVFTRDNGAPHCTNPEMRDPILIATGNKFQQETDLTSVGPQPLILRRSYNSSDGIWRFNYKQRLVVSDAETMQVVRPDGQALTYTLANSTWSSDGDVYHQLEENAEGYPWKLSLQSGSIEYYDDQGRVVLLQSPQGQLHTLDYVDNSMTIHNALGDQLVINHNDQGLPIDAVLNGTESVTYEYDDWERLTSMTRSDATRRLYHYEFFARSYHLTGITDERGVRFATWDYDEQGRGILSEHAGQERTELVYNADGSTTVTNPLGKQTTYHFAEIEGLKRVTQVEGHASANCLAANKDYSYYANGLLKTRTDWQGVTTRFEYNDRGLKTRRIEAEGTPQERITSWTWDPVKPLNLTRTEGGKTTTYQYNAMGQMIRQQESADQ
ncbi:DUF6531 domain-containing protein [Motiliproteus sp. MSK22-1]|uniref:DUF6531 domain-containing protein n=1 Tax=Motiliproteus sp. MSK22-1 TaxID=1897630 RepID=UPI00097547AC|nr:DUF6531 domain-containing protein [Motiliproteus sp. MSK22-1]OMH39303.1 hypothetical protein BGP75_04240 [Motiliproteus sp. MSK22-1]